MTLRLSTPVAVAAAKASPRFPLQSMPVLLRSTQEIADKASLWLVNSTFRRPKTSGSNFRSGYEPTNIARYEKSFILRSMGQNKHATQSIGDSETISFSFNIHAGTR